MIIIAQAQAASARSSRSRLITLGSGFAIGVEPPRTGDFLTITNFQFAPRAESTQPSAKDFEAKSTNPLVAGGEYAWGWFADETGSWANHSGEIFNGSLNYQTYILLQSAAGKALCILGKFPGGTNSPDWREVDAWLR